MSKRDDFWYCMVGWLVGWWEGGYTPLHASITPDVSNEEWWEDRGKAADMEPNLNFKFLSSSLEDFGNHHQEEEAQIDKTFYLFRFWATYSLWAAVGAR